MNELVYPVYKYLEEDVPPSIMFIPSKIMLFKLMMIAWIYDQAGTGGLMAGVDGADNCACAHQD